MTETNAHAFGIRSEYSTQVCIRSRKSHGRMQRLWGIPQIPPHEAAQRRALHDLRRRGWMTEP